MLRSFVIPVLDFSPHSRFNIHTLLDDLTLIDGEVICIFNSEEVFNALRYHRRIDKFAFNKLNAGVSRSWNIGINLAEGDAIFILNADLHIGKNAVDKMQEYLFTLPNAVIVGPQGSRIDFKNMKVIHYYEKGTFSEPVKTHDVSGFLFCLHAERFRSAGLAFDVRYSPCFFEEWDMALQIGLKGLACYAVPVQDFEHDWGISAVKEDVFINYFGKLVSRNEVLAQNKQKFLHKWASILRQSHQ